MEQPRQYQPETRMITGAEVAEAARRCAVRGVETAGGRVAAAMTEKGMVVCDNVVLAGRAWSRLFAAISATICRSSRSWAR
jgi:glycine/D-amino acid oxidase-like deaminating enzyme